VQPPGYACPGLERNLRYALGQARHGTESHFRGAWGRLQRHPPCAALVPRPSRPRAGRALRLTHALVASDLNAAYLDFWPLVKRAWPAVAGLEPVLVLVAEPAEVPVALRHDPAVHVFAPLAGVHTAFQAQCIRLLYPALLAVEGGVVTSDADMVPLNRRYFHRPAAQVDEDHFVAYRNVLLANREVPICYNAARPATWRTVFRIDSDADVRRRLREWSDGVEYAGIRGEAGWATDQHLLHDALLEHGRSTGTVWILDDHYTGFRRLERARLLKGRGLDGRERRGILRGAYSDFHCASPEQRYREVNELAVELAAAGSRRRERIARLFPGPRSAARVHAGE
jgi:hypothetical protein